MDFARSMSFLGWNPIPKGSSGSVDRQVYALFREKFAKDRGSLHV